MKRLRQWNLKICEELCNGLFSAESNTKETIVNILKKSKQTMWVLHLVTQNIAQWTGELEKFHNVPPCLSHWSKAHIALFKVTITKFWIRLPIIFNGRRVIVEIVIVK